MSNPSRREKIEAMLRDEPGDTFLRYSLALELDKEGRHDDSLAWLGELMRDAPPYVPAFFMAGQQLVRLDRAGQPRKPGTAKGQVQMADDFDATPEDFEGYV